MMQKNMTETLAYGHSSESAQRGLLNKYYFNEFLRSCILDKSSLSIGRVILGK